jgi:alanine racemase
MDMLMADVTGIDEVAAGDEVVLIGDQDGASITADEVAALCDTISYEVLTGIMARVPRFYERDGVLVAVDDHRGYRRVKS